MLLINAVKSGHLSQVKYFLRVGIDVNLTDENGQTAVIHCCFLEDNARAIKMFKLLLVAQDIEINKKDKSGRSLLSWISFLGRTEMFACLLDHFHLQVDFKILDEEANSLSMLAVLSGSLKMVASLLDVLKEFSLLDQVNCFNDKGMCPLIVAFQRKDRECARMLVNEGKASISSVFQYIRYPATRYRCLENVYLPTRGQAFHTFVRAAKLDPKNTQKLPTEKELLEFLFSDREDSRKQEHEERGSKARANSAYSSKKNLILDSKTASKRRPSSSKPILDNSERLSAVPSSLATLSIETDTSRSRSGTFTPLFTGLYEIYSTQLSNSYRAGIHTQKASPPSPPSDTIPPRKESETQQNRRSLRRHISNVSEKNTKAFSLAKRSSNLTSSSMLARPVEESLFDRQMRLKYTRSSRASSVLVAKFPQVSETARTRNRSRTISQL